ncbi:TIR domain-containing protein [Micromonospora sp. CB01531]|uniref:TIR domain-containing protein n=1 Tax=Micromonospora sp. CB01531 TaxID=1718947 RepID=UPI00093A9F5F|nr:TIR domain-containing protein [Micromonospora sp. CB01531]
MSNQHNVFISHRHEDDALVAGLKDLLKRQGANVRDSSVTSETPNRAKDPDYIKSLLAERIQWAGKIVVIVSPDTKKHHWVDWEIEYANRHPDKRIIGVWAPNAHGCDLPEPLERHADAVVAWRADAIIRALNGENNWQAPNGSDASARTISRIGC